ncbi:MAG TPA: alpha/beta hydrolase [Polyangiaceae bacterium]
MRTRPASEPSSEPTPTLVFCDGIACDGFIWKYLWNELGRTHDEAHFHYRGHGRSAKPVDSNRIDIAAHAEDVFAVREHLGDPPCVILGHSMGCQVALEAYHLHPEKVRALVLICGSFGKVTSTVRGVPVLDMILPKLLSVAEKSPDLVRALWSRIPTDIALNMALKSGDIDPERVQREDVKPYLDHVKRLDFTLFLRMLRAAGEHTAEEYLGDVKVPVLIIAGEKDTLTPPYLSQAMAMALPKAELLVVPHGTHVAPLEQPDVVNPAIRTFLDAL